MGHIEQRNWTGSVRGEASLCQLFLYSIRETFVRWHCRSLARLAIKQRGDRSALDLLRTAANSQAGQSEQLHQIEGRPDASITYHSVTFDWQWKAQESLGPKRKDVHRLTFYCLYRCSTVALSTASLSPSTSVESRRCMLLGSVSMRGTSCLHG